jgi:hypothetical protein
MDDLWSRVQTNGQWSVCCGYHQRTGCIALRALAHLFATILQGGCVILSWVWCEANPDVWMRPDVGRVMDLIINSLYSDRDLFMRKLVSNYSAYLVADKVMVVTKSMQDLEKVYKWESSADSLYTVEEVAAEEIESISGTKLILHMKEDANDCVDSSKMEELLLRYSEFIKVSHFCI